MPDRQRTADSRVPELDGLRGVAIALVLWCHLVNPYLPLGFAHPLAWVRAIGDMAWCGVDLFFVLSGYFIGGILLDRRDSPRLARVFYARRALRILPLYYATLAVGAAGAALGWIRHEYPAWTYALFLTNFALAAGNIWDAPMLSPLWSIAVEEQFYLTAPWVARWIPARRIPLLLGALIAAAIALRIGVHLAWPGRWMAEHMLMPLRMDLLATGALIAWLVRSDRPAALFARLRQTWALWVAAALALLFGLAANLPGLGQPLLIWFGYTLIVACFGLIVLLVAGARPPALCRALARAPLVHLGRHSYFVYLGHMVIGQPLITWLGGENLLVSTPRGLLVVATGIGATWAAAVVSWRWFESPLITLGHRLRY